MLEAVSARPAFDLNDPATFVLDLDNPKPKDVLAIVEAFEVAMKANPEIGNLPVTTNWHDITPAIAVNLLLRNRPGANRKIDPSTVYYYACQMKRGDWKETGQPILTDDQERLADAQHRLYACLISGVTFRSFVVTGVKAIPNLFAYIDNTRARTAASALQTAGFNGVSPTIAKVIKLAEEVAGGYFNPTGPSKLERLSPADVIKLADKYPNVRSACRSAASDWEEVVTYLGGRGRKDIVAYFGMRIIDLHDEGIADDFFENLMNPDETAVDDPFMALRKEIDKDNRAERPMKKQHMLAAMIKTFNAWHRHESLGRRWMLQVNEDFPTLDERTTEAAAAE